MINYDVNKYISDIDTIGLQNTWKRIIDFCYANTTDFLNIKNFGELYEIGLAHVNKQSKKELGKYYTPEDVATVMSKWLLDLPGNNICDMCCGTGNLILSYLNLLPTEEAVNLIKNGNIYLYDIDPLALDICRHTICIKYGKEYYDKINIYCGDALSKNCMLPDDSKVISNPPYFKINNIDKDWEDYEVIKDSKDFYSSIMCKILKQSCSSVIITPYSFISGDKFYSLRKEMNKHEGFIVSFDNVPGNIFNGRKHGIFNTNSSNSVRAAITVTTPGNNGYRCSPLIRFKTEEREELLNNEVLEQTISNDYQRITDENRSYAKYSNELSDLFNQWVKNGKPLSTILVENSNYKLCVPNSCRYYTTAACKDLDRTGKHELYFKDQKSMLLSYCLLNSSFNYWWWRIYDGGVNYSLGLLKRLPIINFTQSEENQLVNMAQKMIEEEDKFLVYKKNAGKDQENIKFPEKYRTEINNIILKHFGLSSAPINSIHNNHFFKAH